MQIFAGAGVIAPAESVFRCSGVSLERNAKCFAQLPDFMIRPGESAALIGPSGSGKTTALLAFALIRPLLKGMIEIGGENPWLLKRAARDAFRGRRIGMVFQSFHLVDALSVEDNILLAGRCAGRPADRGRVATLLDRLGIGQLRSEPADRISQGQAQRVAVARALYNKPTLILADEPTSALDDANADAMMQLLIESAALESAALLITTHDRRVLNAIGHIHRIEGAGA